MNQQSLEDLLAFIELRNITLAAQRRNISQPAYSRRLKAIEDAENISLVDRSGRPSVPTKNLTSMKAELESALVALKKVSKGFNRNTEVMRTISIAAVHSLSSGLLPVAIQKIEALIDQSEIQIHSANQDICFQLLMTEQVSAMLAYEKEDMPLQAPQDLVEKTVVNSDQLVPVCSPAFMSSLDDMIQKNQAIPLISYPSDIFLGRVINNDVLTRSTHKFTQKFIAGMSSVNTKIAISGLGVAWIPVSVINNEIQNNDLIIINKEGFETIDLVVAMLQLRRKKSPAISYLWKALVEALSGAAEAKLNK